jgi:alpha-glucoside transport system permease protein
VVWLDYSRGGGIRGQPEEGESGLPGVRVDLLNSEGEVIKTTYSNENGTYSFNNVAQGQYNIRLNESTFRKPFGGFYWLGPRLVVPAVMFAYIWISTGLSLIIIKAGLSSINRSYMEAARIAGASEFQVFRHVTVPLLFPVLMVVFIRTVISVLKVFDLVLVIAPESVQANATVLALEMWRASFGGMRDFGLGSALATILFLLILPVVYFNIKRFRLND